MGKKARQKLNELFDVLIHLKMNRPARINRPVDIYTNFKLKAKGA